MSKSISKPEQLAPIVLFVYNRPEHTHRTVEALANNALADQSDLIIFSDGPKNNNSQSEIKVRQVRDYLKTITGFKSVKVIERKENWGLAKSIIEGVTEVVKERGKIIVLEDDLVTSPYFLQYMNEGLEIYKNDNQVASIHGYIYPVNQILPETFFLKGADCWGWATWQRAWAKFEPNGRKLLTEIKSKKLEREFNFDNSYPYTKMLRAQTEGKNDSWAIRWYASAFLQNMLTLYPGRSLVQNIGTDQSGTHPGQDQNLAGLISNQPIKVTEINCQENQESRKIVEDYFYRHRPKRVITYFKKIKKLIPCSLKKIFIRKIYGFFGPYKNWSEAQKHSKGYNQDLILEKVKSAAIAVKNGQAAFERDSVLFAKSEYSWPLLASLLAVANEHNGHLNILDFGGSLGSSYFQHRDFLKFLKSVSWNIVEQSNFVATGRELFEDSTLHFYDDLDRCLKEENPNTLLLGSSLQYLEHPYDFLEKSLRHPFSHIIIERTNFSQTKHDFLAVQKVPPAIYRASYPCWFLSESKLLDFFAQKDYTLVAELPFPDNQINQHGIKGVLKGFLFSKKN